MTSNEVVIKHGTNTITLTKGEKTRIYACINCGYIMEYCDCNKCERCKKYVCDGCSVDIDEETVCCGCKNITHKRKPRCKHCHKPNCSGRCKY